MVNNKSVNFAEVKVEQNGGEKGTVAAENRPMLPLNSAEAKKPKFINPRLLPVKLLVFLIHGGQSATFAFISLHMKSLGITVREIAVVLLLMPILSSIGPPISGSLADRFGNYKVVLIMFTMSSAIFSTCMWFLVPSFGVAVNPSLLLLNQTDYQSLPGNFTINVQCSYSEAPFDDRVGNGNGSHDYDGRSVPRFTPEDYGASWESCSLRGCILPDDPILRGRTSLCYEESKETSRLPFESVGGVKTKICTTSSRFSTADIISFADETKDTLSITPSRQTLFCEIEPSRDSFTNISADHQMSYCSVSCRNSSHLATKQTPTVPPGAPFGNKVLTISMYFLFRFLSFTSSRGVFPLLDAAVMQIARQEGGDFGIQRLFASVGAVVVPPLAGYLTTVASAACGCADFSPSFYLFGVMTVLGGILMFFMDIRVKKPQTHIFRTMGIVLRDPNVVAFLVAVFCSGAAWGFVNGYLFIFLEDDEGFTIPSTTFHLGLVNAAGYAAGIPFLFFSTQLIKLFGHENLVAIVTFCYSARFLLYSFTYNPYLIFPTELLTGVTFLVFILMPQFAMKTAPKYLATLVGLFGAANFGIGGGVGPLIGGFLIHWVGFRITFRVLSIAMAVVGCGYLLVFHLVLKRRAQRKKDLPKLIVHSSGFVKQEQGDGTETVPLGSVIVHDPE